MTLRIGMMTQWYDPEPGSAALPGIISRALRRRGHEVHVLTGFPNYPTGNLYEGYRVRPYQREQIQDITVHRAPLYASHDTDVKRRMLNYLSFACGATGIALTRFPKVDAVLVHSTPATAALPALALKALRRVPYVLHVQDLWPQTVVSSGFLDGGRTGKAELALHVMCDLIYRHAASIAVTSPGMINLIASRSVDPSKIHLVTNWADEQAFQPAPRDGVLAASLGLNRPFTVMYAGNFGVFQALDVVVDAAELLRERTDIAFALVGGGVTEMALRKLVISRTLDNVTFVPSQPFSRMADVLALGDVQLVSLRDLPLFRSTLPSKLQATLAAGRPILGAVTGDAASVIRRADAGEVVTPGSAGELADAVIRLADAPREQTRARGEVGRRYYLQHFSEQVASQQLVDLLAAAAASDTVCG